MGVTIGTRACTNITITDVVGLGEFVCSAPPGPGNGVLQLRVSVEASGSATSRFSYDAPNVTRVLGTPCDAALPCPLQVSPSLWVAVGSEGPCPLVNAVCIAVVLCGCAVLVAYWLLRSSP